MGTGRFQRPTYLSALLFAFVISVPQSQIAIHIAASDAIDVARIVAAGEGYDVRNTKIYSFDLLTRRNSTPLLKGYTSVEFDINGMHRSAISINELTGQTIDPITCEVFAFPSLKPFEDDMLRLNKAKPKTPRELAQEAGCEAPKVLTKPIPYPKPK